MVAIFALVGLLGLAIGSFLNVVIHRVPLDQSVMSPRSACPSCATPIANRDNIPVVSWLRLGGRCRHCESPISVRYPVVELGTGVLFVATVAVVGLEWSLAAYLWFLSVTIALVFTDLDHHRLPNRIMLSGTVVGVVLLGGGAVLDARASDFVRALGAGAVYFAVLLVVALLARGGFGFGDVKLAFVLGVFTGYGGWAMTAVAAFGGFFLGGLASLGLIVTRRRGRKDSIPFGPAMILASWIAIAWGQAIVDWYLG